MINKNLLNSKMALNDYSQRDIAKVLNKTVTTINFKINGKIVFLPEEIAKIQKFLNLSDSDVIEIFISPNK